MKRRGLRVAEQIGDFTDRQRRVQHALLSGFSSRIVQKLMVREPVCREAAL
jgi:hypothetical protein